MRKNIKLLLVLFVGIFLGTSSFFYLSFADDDTSGSSKLLDEYNEGMRETKKIDEYRERVCKSFKNIRFSQTTWKGSYKTVVTWESEDPDVILKKIDFVWYHSNTDSINIPSWVNKAEFTYVYPHKWSDGSTVMIPKFLAYLSWTNNAIYENLVFNYNYLHECSVRKDGSASIGSGWSEFLETTVFPSYDNGIVEPWGDCDSHQLWCNRGEWMTPTCFVRPFEETFSPQQGGVGTKVTAKYAINKVSGGKEFWFFAGSHVGGSAKNIIDIYGIDLYWWDGEVTKDAKPADLWFYEWDFKSMWENERRHWENIKNNTWVNEHNCIC